MSFKDVGMSQFALKKDPLVTEADIPIEDEPMRKASLASSTFNLTNSAIGMGTLAIAHSYEVVGLGTGLILTAFLAVVTGVTLYFYCRLAEATRQYRFPELGRAVAGKGGEVIMVIVIFLYLLAPLNAYIKIIGEYTGQVITLIKPETAGNWYVSKEFLTPVLTIFVVAPMSFFKSLDKLSKLSLFCVSCLYYLVVIIICDYCVALRTGEPALPTVTWFRFSVSGIARTSSTLLMAFNSVPNILGVYEELKNPTTARQVTVVSFTSILAGLCYASVGLFGFLLFGDTVTSNVASQKETVPYIFARLLIGASMGFSWPLVVFPARNCLEWLLDAFAQQSSSFGKLWNGNQKYRFEGLTIFLVFFSIALTYAFEDLGDLLNIFGAVVATNLMLTVPCFFMLSMGDIINIQTWERWTCYVTILLGFFFFFAGVIPQKYLEF